MNWSLGSTAYNKLNVLKNMFTNYSNKTIESTK